MSIAPYTKLPIPETEPSVDWSLVSHCNSECKMNYLTYAVERDFLSTPRTFAAVAFRGNNHVDVNFQQFFAGEYCQLIQIDSLPQLAGFYHLTASEPDLDNLTSDSENLSNQPSQILLMVLPGKVVEIEYIELQLLANRYHCRDSKAALVELLSSTHLPFTG